MVIKDSLPKYTTARTTPSRCGCNPSNAMVRCEAARSLRDGGDEAGYIAHLMAARGQAVAA